MGRHHSAQLDGIAVPGHEAWAWNISVASRPWLSDHAFLTAKLCPKDRPAGKACSPASFKALPSEAIEDLR
eukprot:11441943-Heterocapsa_arctica.AAC.1